MKMICHSHANKHIFTRKVLHMASFWKWGVLELGSGLDYRAVRVIYVIYVIFVWYLEFVCYLFIYHDFWKYKVWNLFAFYLNSNTQNFFILTKIICQTPQFFLFCFKWAMVVITLFTSQTSSLAQVLKLIGETYYATSILIFGSWITFLSNVVNQCCCCCCCSHFINKTI